MIKSLAEFIYRKKVFLYGTGFFSRWISKYLRSNKIKVYGYIVSDKHENDFFMSRPVFCIKEIELSSDDCIIVSVIKTEMVEEIKSILRTYARDVAVYYPEDNEDLKKICIKAFRKERNRLSKKRKAIDIFNYRGIARPLPFGKTPIYFRDDEEMYAHFCCINYGIDRCIRKFLRKCELDELASTVLHGAWIYPRFNYRELNPPDHNIFCMSSHIFEESGVKLCNNIYGIGPYIQWVKPLLSKKKIMELKRRFGKTLLVVPSHVQLEKEGGNIAFNTRLFIEAIEEIKNKHGFQTVLVSIGPYTDIKEVESVFGKMRYKLISSGEPHDSFFLSRLRTFIEISDVAMGNDVCSTFPGYSLALNRPYYHFEEEIIYRDALVDNKLRGYSGADDEKANLAKKEFLDCFGEYTESISKMQRDYVEKYWGIKRKLRKN